MFVWCFEVLDLLTIRINIHIFKSSYIQSYNYLILFFEIKINQLILKVKISANQIVWLVGIKQTAKGFLFVVFKDHSHSNVYITLSIL